VISQRGHDDIERLLAATELENVPADVRLANDLLGTAARHVTSARSIANDDPIGAFQAAYDALRKPATALLAAQGLRATSRGGQLAVQDAVTAQFGGSTGTSAFAGFAGLRRTRNTLECPTADSPGVDSDDVDWAIKQADRAVKFARDLVSSDRLGAWT
jgi:hypothetical protein